LTSEKEGEIRISTLNFVKKLIETLNIKEKDEKNRIDIRITLLNYYYPQLISDEVYCEEFYALYHYLFNIESLKPNDIQIDKIIEKLFDYLYEFYINNHNKEKE
jgi:predicted nucleotidyltransferase